MTPDAALLLAAARRLDLRDISAAVDELCALMEPGRSAATMPLWRAALRQSAGTGQQSRHPSADAVFEAVETCLANPDPARASTVMSLWRRAVQDGAPSLLVLPVAQALMSEIAGLPPQDRELVFAAVMSEGQPDMVRRLWRRVLCDGGMQPLDGWQAGALFAAARAVAPDDPVAALQDDLDACGRADLGPFLRALLGTHGLEAPADIASAVAAVPAPEHRRLVLDFLVRAPATPARYLELAKAIDVIAAGLDAPLSTATAGLLVLRRSLAAGNWHDAEVRAAVLIADPGTHVDAVGLRAAAQIGLGHAAPAAANAAYLASAPDLAWHDRGRGAALGWMVRMGADNTRHTPAAALPHSDLGRPLVQSLWVGPRLRWIEQMALRSWLLNGWRVQLFVHDPPDGVPEGVELMDASAILPRTEVFREAAASGMHRGSLGAFSDRFRYALLAQRGGLWSDTDVINLCRFEPEGCRLVATEVANVGIDTLNGAWLAAPPGDAVIAMLAARADAIVQRGQTAFARIGPQLLCEVMSEHGTGGFAILEPDVINPLSWSETRRWFDPADAVAADPRLAGAAGLHVFTETWRQIGVRLDAPPPPATFLGRCAARIAAAPLPGPGGPRDAVRRLIGMASAW